MPQRRAHHYRNRHATDRANAQQMQPGGLPGFCQKDRWKPQNGQTQRDECIGHMQHQQQRRAPCSRALPTRQPQEVQSGGQQQQPPAQLILGRSNPGHQSRRARQKAKRIVPAKGHGHRAGIIFGVVIDQPVAREAGNDPPANQHYQENHHGKAGPASIIRCANRQNLDVEDDIGQQEKRYGYHHHQVAPVAPGDDLDRDHQHNRRQKRTVDSHDDQPTQSGGPGHGNPPGEPQTDQCGQWPAPDRHPPGPVRNRREQEAADNGSRITEQHFVDVPVHRRELRVEGQFSGIKQYPQGNGYRGEPGCTEKKRTESVAEKGRPVIHRAFVLWHMAPLSRIALLILNPANTLAGRDVQADKKSQMVGTGKRQRLDRIDADIRG